MSKFNLKQYFGAKKYYEIKYEHKNCSRNQTFLLKQDTDEFLSIKQIVSYYCYFENRENYILLMGAIFGNRISFDEFKLLFLQNWFSDQKDSEAFAEVFRYSENDKEVLKSLVIDPKIIQFFDRINIFFLAYIYFDEIPSTYTKKYPDWFRSEQADKGLRELFARCASPLEPSEVYRAYKQMKYELGMGECLKSYDIRIGLPIFRKI